MGSTWRIVAAFAATAALLVAGCGDDDDTTEVDTPTDVDADADADVGDGDEGDAAGGIEPAGEGGAGFVILDGEEIALGSGLCYLEEQEAAAGGGSILATAQASGTNAAGEDVNIDFTRFSEDSQFAGDDVSLNVGPLTDSVSYSGGEPEGTVSIENGVVSATDFPVTGEELTELTISFEIDCN